MGSFRVNYRISFNLERSLVVRNSGCGKSSGSVPQSVMASVLRVYCFPCHPSVNVRPRCALGSCSSTRGHEVHKALEYLKVANPNRDVL